MNAFLVTALAASLLGAACSKNSTPVTTAPTTTTTVATPTTTENFAGTLAVGGSNFYSFSVAASGTVNLTLLSVTGAGVPPTVMVSVGLGVPAGTGCPTSTTVTTASGTTAQLTGTYNTGVYCAKVADVGNLFAPAAFSLDIAHP